MHRTFPEYLAGDIAVASKEYLEQHEATLLRFSGDPSTLFETDSKDLPAIASPILEQVEIPGGQSRAGLREGLGLLRFDGVPIAAYWRWERGQPQRYEVSVLSGNAADGQRMLDDFSAFAESRRAITSELFARVSNALNTRIRTHIGEGEDPHVLTHSFPEYQIANISIQLKVFFDRLGAEFTGAGTAGGFEIRGFGEWDPLSMLKPANIDRFGHFSGYDQTAASFEQIETDAASTRIGLREAILLFRFEDVPMFARGCRTGGMREEFQLTVVSRDLGAARRLLQEFLEYERANSILRGRLIRPQIDYSDRVTNAEILPSEEVTWERVVLPDELRRRIERDVLAYIRSASALRANDIEPKRSFLFHGPPGTGKTFMCKLLATSLQGFTSVLIAGENLHRPAGAFALARGMAPALVFFEDVDLVAKDRDGNPFPLVLGGLLNELDGLPRGELVYAVFTTNRLNVLEEALAQRPGRVDMIISFPLPEAPLRRKLVRLYAGRSRLEDAEVDWLVERTDGVTPAFLREFMKEAVFTAIHAGAIDEQGIARVDRNHLVQTFEHFAEIGREHGADRILGFRA